MCRGRKEHSKTGESIDSSSFELLPSWMQSFYSEDEEELSEERGEADDTELNYFELTCDPLFDPPLESTYEQVRDTT